MSTASWTVFIGLATIVLGVIGAGIYYRQLKLMQAQMAEQQRQWRVGLRPYMLPQSSKILYQDSDQKWISLLKLSRKLAYGDNLWLQVRFKNTGNSPAVDVHFNADTKVVSQLPTDSHPWNTGDELHTVRTVPKDGNFFIGFGPDVPLTQAEIADIMTPAGKDRDKYRKYLIIFGYMTYGDFFEKNSMKYSTRFCFHYSPVKDTMIGSPHHNTAQ